MGSRILLTITFAAMILCGVNTVAQEAPQIKASLSADSVMIGDRVGLTVEVDKDMMQVVAFPDFNRMLTEHIEILEEGRVDTIERDGRNIKISRQYTLTSFEEGIHTMGRFPMLYLDKNITDTILSLDSLVLKVSTFSVDTVSQTIYDIKKPLDAPVKFGEFSGYLFGGLLALALLAVLVYFLVRYFSRKKETAETAAAEPPHVIAIRKLERLHEQKYWQTGKQKQYYSAITDILREYIEGRYGMKAPEMSTEEIRTEIAPMLVGTKTPALLAELLDTADLVKFAKYKADADTNEAMYYKAYDFVEGTKEISEAAEAGTGVDNSETAAAAETTKAGGI